jgi:hypothetical protein
VNPTFPNAVRLGSDDCVAVVRGSRTICAIVAALVSAGSAATAFAHTPRSGAPRAWEGGIEVSPFSTANVNNCITALTKHKVEGVSEGLEILDRGTWKVKESLRPRKLPTRRTLP